MVLLNDSPLSTPALTLDEVVRELEYLPTAPRVLPRLKHLLADGNTAIHDVVELVNLDPGIAARVLQFGNSTYFSQGMRCYTVAEAIGRVGYGQIYELVATAVASQVLVRPLNTYNLHADELWNASVACALSCEALASHFAADRNIAYTIGLLHNIGKIAIDDWAMRHQPDLVFQNTNFPLETCESERKALGFHQAEVGATLMRLWAFPQVMSEPVRWQYLPNGTAVHFQYAALLHLAKWLQSSVLHPNIAIPLPSDFLMKKLRISENQLTKLSGEIASKFRTIIIRLESLCESQAPLHTQTDELRFTR